MEQIHTGRLIVFEGGEGSGKTTQLQRSHDWLLQHPRWHQWQRSGRVSDLVITREPGGTELGQKIRQLLLHPDTTEPIRDRAELLLYAADRAQHVETCLKPALAAGALVLCDRYVDSTTTYQGWGRGLHQPLIDQLNEIATGGLCSDLTLWLDVEVETGLRRASRRSHADRMEQNSLDFHLRIRQGFAALAERDRDRIIRIDANPPAAEVSQQIQKTLEQVLLNWYGQE